MPAPTIKEMVPMRDGVRLATYVYLPKGPGRFPTILVRTVYKNGIINWGNSHPELYNAAGYAMVWQTTRGKGESEGIYHFLAPERPDGYDTVEWIAAQPWSDGNVGMDHASYLGSAQLEAASAKPPHLKAIVPYVPAVDLFRELPYDGGIFTRYHVLNWHRLISVNNLSELTEGFMNAGNVMEDPKWHQLLTSRPVIDAADGFLKGAELAEYRAFLEHPTIDAFWRERQYTPQDYARMDLPVMLVAGNFDPTVGTLTAWRGLEANAPHPEHRHLLIGPWTHGQTYSAHVVGPGDPGGPAQAYPEPVTKNGPYEFGDAAAMDMFALRISFFDHYLKGKAVSVPLPNRVRVFVTGSNVWREFSTIPIPERHDTKLFLTSGGHANSAAGDGALAFGGSSGAADHVVSDPNDPFVDLTYLWINPTGQRANPEKRQDVLVYTSAPLAKDVTIVGEPEAHLEVTADTRDADVIVNVHEIYPDGKSVRLGVGGALRLRYREGFDREVLLKPGATYSVRVPMSYIGHTIKAGHRIQFQLSGTSFPFKDPNPNTGEPIATAVKMQRANVSIVHDPRNPSFILLPIVPVSGG
jgi:hypothetical protein